MLDRRPHSQALFNIMRDGYCSDHSPVLFTLPRQLKHTTTTTPPIPDWLCFHPAFVRNSQLMVQEFLSSEEGRLSDNDNFEVLAQIKALLHRAAALAKEELLYGLPGSAAEQAHRMLAAFRAWRRGDSSSLRRLCEHFPLLRNHFGPDFVEVLDYDSFHSLVAASVSAHLDEQLQQLLAAQDLAPSVKSSRAQWVRHIAAAWRKQHRRAGLSLVLPPRGRQLGGRLSG